MRKILLVAVLVAACGGKKKKEADCTMAVDNAMTVSQEAYKANNVAETTKPKIRAVSLARCTEDKWTADIRNCYVAAKTDKDVEKCHGAMTKEQQDNMLKAITAAMATEPAGSGSAVDPGSGSAPDPGTGTGSAAAGTGSAAPIAGLPAECAEYKSWVDKLAACDKYPAASRDMLQKAFADASKSWANLDKLPDTAKKAMIDGCKAGSEAIKQAGAVCGW